MQQIQCISGWHEHPPTVWCWGWHHHFCLYLSSIVGLGNEVTKTLNVSPHIGLKWLKRLTPGTGCHCLPSKPSIEMVPPLRCINYGWFLRQIPHRSSQVFVVAALLLLPFGRKRVNCDHHMPSMWRSTWDAEIEWWRMRSTWTKRS